MAQTQPSDNDTKFMRLAIDQACQGVQSGDGQPFGAVIVKDGKVFHDKDPTAHAEVNAIRLACKALNSVDLSGCVIYTSCYPCLMCLGACLWAKFDGIFYALTRDQAADVGFDDRAFHEFVKDPQKLQQNGPDFRRLIVDGHVEPFEIWRAMEKPQH